MAGSMIGNKSIDSCPAVAGGDPPVKVTRSKEGNRKKDAIFSEKLSISYTINNRSFSLELTQDGFRDRVHTVDISINEKAQGKGFASLCVFAAASQENDASCLMSSEFSGAVGVQKGKFYSPPFPDLEFVKYNFRDPKSKSCFLLQKVSRMDFVEKIRVAHFVPISEDAFYGVFVDIENKRGAGLCVEAQSPVKYTNDVAEQYISAFSGSVERKKREQLLKAVFGGPAN